MQKINIKNKVGIDDQAAIQRSKIKRSAGYRPGGSWDIDLMTYTQTWYDELYKIYGMGKDEIPVIVELFFIIGLS